MPGKGLVICVRNEQLVWRGIQWFSVSATPQAQLYICQVVRRAEAATKLPNSCFPISPTTQHWEILGNLGAAIREQQQMAPCFGGVCTLEWWGLPSQESSSLLCANKYDLLKDCKMVHSWKITSFEFGLYLSSTFSSILFYISATGQLINLKKKLLKTYFFSSHLALPIWR